MAQQKELPPPNPNLLVNADALLFDMIEKLIHSAFKEMKEFSDKKPNEIISPIKAASLNKLCEPIKRILNKELSAEFLYLFDIENLPSYSDAILFLTNYQTAMKQFRSNYYGYNNDCKLAWLTKENPGGPDGSSRYAYERYYKENFD
jgi:hypothetical protein